MTLDINTIALIGLITPFLTAILTRVHTPDWKKGILSITQASIIGMAAAAFSAGPGFNWTVALNDGIAVWGTHLLSYFGVTATMVGRLNAAITDRRGPPRIKRWSMRQHEQSMKHPEGWVGP